MNDGLDRLVANLLETVDPGLTYHARMLDWELVQRLGWVLASLPHRPEHDQERLAAETVEALLPFWHRHQACFPDFQLHVTLDSMRWLRAAESVRPVLNLFVCDYEQAWLALRDQIWDEPTRTWAYSWLGVAPVVHQKTAVVREGAG